MKSHYPYQAAGVLVFARNTKRFLILHRSPTESQPGTWGIPGGSLLPGETPRQGALREADEEIGDHDLRVSAEPIYVWVAPDSSFAYSTFFGTVRDEFDPELADGEHVDWKWVHLPQWLQHDNLHFGVEQLLQLAMPAILELIL